MAYQIIRDFLDEYQPGREVTAVLDSASDLGALGTDFAPGSVAIVAAVGTPTYILNASREWVVV